MTERPVGSTPFSLKEAPVTLRVEARRLPSWRAIDGAADPVRQSPVTSEEPQQSLTLVPYAAAKMKSHGLSSFEKLRLIRPRPDL